jgi:hypothetical protein
MRPSSLRRAFQRLVAFVASISQLPSIDETALEEHALVVQVDLRECGRQLIIVAAHQRVVVFADQPGNVSPHWLRGRRCPGNQPEQQYDDEKGPQAPDSHGSMLRVSFAGDRELSQSENFALASGTDLPPVTGFR